MNRSEFLKTLPGAVALAAPVANGGYTGKRRVSVTNYDLPAKAETIFPLLCPVREYDWIDGWTCNLVHSASGVAEQDCVFTTSYLGTPMVWTCCLYDPPRRIQYVAVAPDLVVMHLDIRLQPAGSATRMEWKRTFTSLSPQGEQGLESWTKEKEQRLGQQLRHFIETGKMQRHPAGGH